MRKPVGERTRRTGPTVVDIVFGGLLCVALLLVLIRVFGFLPVLAAVWGGSVLFGLTVLWGLSYLRAPDLTRNASVFLVIAFITLAWLPMHLLHQRETARRQTTANAFRELGQAIQGLEDTGPRGRFEDGRQQHRDSQNPEPGVH